VLISLAGIAILELLNYNTGMKKITCIVCRLSFNVSPSREENAKFCSKECMNKGMIGHRSFHFKGGRLVHKGYVYLLSKGHPNGDRDGYVLEHRLVIEKSIGRYLGRKEVVHHKNHKRGDNRIENLELLPSQSEHFRGHKKEWWKEKKAKQITV
jgi:hypothetical protein